MDWLFNADNQHGQQYLLSLVVGIALAPFGKGIFLLIVWILVYELIYYLAAKYFGKLQYWNSETRGGIALASLLGWIIGRSLLSNEVLQVGYCPLTLNAHDGAIAVRDNHIVMADGTIKTRK